MEIKRNGRDLAIAIGADWRASRCGIGRKDGVGACEARSIGRAEAGEPSLCRKNGAGPPWERTQRLRSSGPVRQQPGSRVPCRQRASERPTHEQSHLHCSPSFLPHRSGSEQIVEIFQSLSLRTVWDSARKSSMIEGASIMFPNMTELSKR